GGCVDKIPQAALGREAEAISPCLSSPRASSGEPLGAGTTHEEAPAESTSLPRDHAKPDDRRRCSLPSCGLSSASVALPVERVPRAGGLCQRARAGRDWTLRRSDCHSA